MQRVGLDFRPVLQQPIQDVDGLPDAARTCAACRCEMSSISLTSSAAASAANWRSLVWAIPLQERVRIDQSAQPVKPFHPEPNGLGVAGPGACFRRLKRSSGRWAA